MIPTCRLLVFVLLRKFEGFAVAFSMKGSALLFIPTYFSAIDLPSFCLRGREESILIFLICCFVS